MNSGGINFKTRRYSAPVLEKYINEECELRYNPYNLLSVWVLLEDNFYEIPCVRARSNLSADLEVYNKSLWISRTHKDYKNLPDGAICDDFAFDSMDVQEDIVDGAIAKTSAYKELKLNPGSTSNQETPWLLPQPIPTLPNALIEHDAAEDHLADDLDDYKPVILIDTLDE
ncbi:Mu transposase C-terminal domain-containing protein [Pseudomonas rhodesiae]